ncbi:MAG: TCR/Tet family MFS transporter [Bacteroidota bacterium]
MEDHSSRRALTFIFVTVLIDVIGLGIILPVLPALIQEIHGGTVADASFYGGLLTFAYSSMQFLLSPVIGALSDRFGRRPVLLASLFGFGIDYILMGLASSILWLFIGRIIAGITGASFTTAGAYIADVSPPEKRAQGFGMLGAAFGVGFIIGPVIGGLLGHFGPRTPFFAAAALAILNALYGYFILPESLRKENRRLFDWRRAHPLSTLRQLGRYPVVLSLLVSFVFIYVAGHANQSTWTYFTIEKFGWNEKQVGYSLGFVGLMIAVVQGGLIRVVVPRLGQRRSVYVGLTCYALGFILYSFASEGWMMYVFMMPVALGGLAGPSLQSIMSSKVPANEQGEFQGALTGVISLTSILGPLLMTNLFSVFSQPGAVIYFPGAPFLAAAVLTSLSLYFAWRVLRKSDSESGS